MKCEQYEGLFAGWINNELKPAERETLEQHLNGCAACREELASMQQLWAMMDEVEVPEPSASMKTDFTAMLNDFKATEANKKGSSAGIRQQLGWLLQWRQKWPLAYTFAIILVSFGCGYLFFNLKGGSKQDKQMADLTTQVHELKQTMALALLENPSASERIRGVSYTTEIKHADKEVIDALLATLNNDPNVNVRLSTLDALTHLAGHPEVRLGLVQSITTQDSPLMQSAIADVMLKLQEKSSVKSFKELLKQKDLDHGVRDKIKETITQLI
ncbi:zf-HC2 domain-containing protein [Mucilaginibacter flavidus]|uniref:zf-HC2 domain-containing protein n=1 Tax=Mucilaginibacter flavidus TaxID=2949309 RepID=UPI0020938AF3|nr:zf-HC2 domain-containing protein [Mucilaginibacter flavidus]MCO5946085.1 HEAT repeat domain-containing protein [Mucilaginibacter flavidus]